MASNQPHAQSRQGRPRHGERAPAGETATVSPAGRLRRLVEDGELGVAPGILDGLSAHLVRRMGFLAGYLTGAGVAAAGFGLPDIGLVGMSKMVDRVSMVTGV